MRQLQITVALLPKVLGLLLAPVGYAATPVTIDSLVSEVGPRYTTVSIDLVGNPHWQEPPTLKVIDNFIEINLRDTVVAEGGITLPIKSPILKKMSAAQTDANTATVRVYTPKTPSLVAEATTVELLGSRLLVTLDHQTYNTNLAKFNEPNTDFIGPPPPQLIAAADLPENQLMPSDLVKSRAADTALKGTPNTLRQKLLQTTGFSAFMLFLLVGIHAYKRFARKASLANKPGAELMKMETLSNLVVSPKQRISMIQVGDERFLIAVGPDQVNFLTALKSTSAPISPIVAKQLEQARSFEQALATAPELPMPAKKELPVAVNKKPVLTAKPKAPAGLAKAATMPAAAPRGTPTKGQRINVRVSDSGVEDLTSKKTASDDVTRLIREKLQQLRTI